MKVKIAEQESNIQFEVRKMPCGLVQPYGLRGGLYTVFDESKNCNAGGLKFSLRQKKSRGFENSNEFSESL